MPDPPDEDLVHKTKETYDGSITSDMLEQYKIYVQSAENVSSRRVSTSRYLLTLSAALMAIHGIQLSSLNHDYWILTVPVAGIAVSVLWYNLIQSHRDMNTIKFKIILELEQHLPVALYTREWDMAKREGGTFYKEATRIEQFLPILFGCLHGLTFVLISVNMIS